MSNPGSVDSFMRGLAATPLPPPPDVHAVWFKAELLRRWEAERRALLPLELAELARGIAGIVAVSIWSVLLWSRWWATPEAWWPLVLSGAVVTCLVATMTLLLCRSAVEQLRPIGPRPGPRPSREVHSSGPSVSLGRSGGP